MRIIKSIKKISNYIKQQKKLNKTIGFVPTMGYLHDGHLSLVKQAKRDNDLVIMSIFVNPTQFGPREDFKKYPRSLKRDVSLAKKCGVDIIFYPSAKSMYQDNYLTNVFVEKISKVLCGKFRPGHFKGVATVVNKLFNIIGPDIAYFGQKDAQQAIIIKKMVSDLNLPIKIKVMPTVRQIDGLAMSSRNVYLNSQQRKNATILYKSLLKAKSLVKSGQQNSQKIISLMRKMILEKKPRKIDYIQIVDAQTLEPVKFIKKKVLIVLAVWFGKTRLIDNIIV